MLNSLFYKKKIFLPTNKVYKDFITVERFCFILKKIISLKKIFGIYNLYNRDNASSILFRKNDETLRNEAVQISIFGIVPSVTYNFNF